ncbi:MAG: Gfo/Idh/MocA family oxidoreductase [Planctomycetes bacterium]|nr:Gfo/Idh/MocA family oxidoreductase [Planctomycetota bacterium]
MAGVGTGPLRGGIVGCGYAAGLHMEAWRRIPDLEITAACDREGDKAIQFCRLHGIHRAFGDIRELLRAERLDFLDVVTGPEAHDSVVGQILAAGRPVLVASPFASDEETARRLVEKARERDVLLAVHQSLRWLPWFLDLRASQSSGRLGQIRRVRFVVRKKVDLLRPEFPRPHLYRKPRLVFLELGIHLVDMARALAGPIEAIRAYMENRDPRPAGEDTALAWLDHANALTTVDITWSSPVPAADEFAVEGDKGVFHGIGLFGEEGEARFTYDCADGREEVPIALAAQAQDAMFETQRRFIEALLEGVQPQNSGFDNLGTLLPALAAYRSAEEGRTIRITA